LCHLVVGHGINCSAVAMRRLLRWQPVHRSSVGWWLFWGFHELALHHRGEAGHTDKVHSTYIMCMMWKCCNLRQFFAGKFMGRRVLEKSRKLVNDVLFLSFLAVCPVELFLALSPIHHLWFVMYVCVCISYRSYVYWQEDLYIFWLTYIYVCVRNLVLLLNTITQQLEHR